MPIVHDPIMVNNVNTDLYATHEAKYGKGGLRTVANIAERDSITFERCEEGMFVLVLSDDTAGGITNLYMLKTNDRNPANRVWEKLNVTGTGTGTIDPALLESKLDKSVYDTDKPTFALKTELDDKANSSEVYSKPEVDQKIADAVTGGTVDLSGYATKTEVAEKLDTATYEAEKADFASKTELGEKLDVSTYNNDKSSFALKSEVGELSDLSTTEKTSLVGAINEVNTKADSKTRIDDTQATVTTTYSSNKIEESLDEKQGVLKGGPGQIVGFNESGEAISTTQLEFGSTLANVVTQDDITSKGTFTYTVSDKGTITSSADFYNKFNQTSVAPRISFGVVYSLEFTVSRNVHFITLEEDLSTGGALIMAIGGGDRNPQAPRQGLTGWLMKVERGSTQTLVEYYDSNNAGIQYNFSVGDKIRVVRNDDGYCTLYRTTNANGTFTEWFKTQRKDVFPYKSLGLSFGITQQEFLNNTPFAARNNIVANEVKIQHTHNPDIEFLRDEISKKEDMNKIYDKFVVVAVAGQSNAVGYDESPVTESLVTKPIDDARIRQLGFYGDDNLQLIPLGWCAQNMQDMRRHNRPGTTTAGTKGMHLPLANALLDYVPEDYGILILPIAFGGTGFNSGNNGTYDAEQKKPTDTANGAGQGTVMLKWGDGTAYYQTLRDRIKHALQLNEKNRFAGIVWCQGENDQGNAENHKTAFEAMTSALFNELNAAGLGSRTPKGTFDKDIWYNMETVAYWYSFNGAMNIWKNYKEWNPKTYIEIPRTADSNVINGTGGTSSSRWTHFGNDAYSKVVAPIVAKALLKGNAFSNITPDKEIPELPFKDNIGSLRTNENPYGADCQEYREANSNDYTSNHSNVTFSTGLTGSITASTTLSGKYSWATCEPTVNFGDVYSIEFQVSRNIYWIAVEGSIENKELVLIGLGGGTSATNGSTTGRVARIAGNDISRVKESESVTGIHRDFQNGDRIRVIKNRDKSTSFYLSHGGGEFYHWFTYPKFNLVAGELLGIAVGISRDEAEGVGSGDVTVATNLKIQKNEITVSNKYLLLKLEALERRLAALENS